jgi:PleD family two-component response regulator
MKFPKRILLIDHQTHLTRMVGSALEATGQYLIRQERHGPRAFQAALHFQPDLILLDVAPVHLEDDPLARQFQSEAGLQNVPLVCLTNVAADGRIGSVGFFAGYTFLAQSFRLDDMISCIREMLHDEAGSRVLEKTARPQKLSS